MLEIKEENVEIRPAIKMREDISDWVCKEITNIIIIKLLSREIFI